MVRRARPLVPERARQRTDRSAKALGRTLERFWAKDGTSVMSAALAYLSEHALEVAGMVATVLGIWLTTRRMLICWPVVLLADLLYLVVFYRAQLYSDAILQIFFVAFTLYGWWHWWRGVVADGSVRVEPLTMRGWIGGLIAGAVGAVLL